MKNVKFVLIVCSLFASAATFAQSNVLDGVYIKEHTPERKVIPYTHLREADVMWARRIWRLMDLREKINLPFYYPITKIANRRSLVDVIMDGILTDGTITAYDDEEFKTVLPKADLMGKLNKADTVMVDDPDSPGNLIQKVVTSEFSSESVKKIRIKEDWFFDKQRSVMDVRIVGMCPIQDVYEADGTTYKGANPLFWIYFPEARFVFVNAEIFNRHNDSERRTYEDIFWKRMFGSFIYKESNVYEDRKIDQYRLGMDALLEAERAKDDMTNYEHDFWEY